MSRWKADAALVFNTVVWGSTFVLVKAALSDISPLLFLGFRFTVAALVLAALFRGTRNARWEWRTAAAGAVAGTFLYAGFLLQTLGLRLTTAPKSAFLTGFTSLMVPLLTRIVYKTRPQVSEVLGVLVATVGLGLMTLQGGFGRAGRGDILTILCAAGFAAYIVTLGHFSERMSFEILSLSQLVTAAVLSWAFAGALETPQVHWRPAVVWAILITGVLATAAAFSIQAWAQQFTTSTRTALIYMLEPVFAWMTSYVLVGEGLSGRAAAGAALISSGVVMVELKPWKARQHPS